MAVQLDGGAAFAASGKATVGQLSAADRKLRDNAIASMATARQRFAAFDFVNATFAAQKAWRSAALYNDHARGVQPGTTEVEKGTRASGASSCPSAGQ